MSSAADLASFRQTVVDARHASLTLGSLDAASRNHALQQIADAIDANVPAILAANARDVDAGIARGLSASFVDRLTLTPARIAEMSHAIRQIADQDDPIGRIESTTTRPNGLVVQKQRIPLGVVAVLYEARPNVTTDAVALAIRSGNAIILKGGRDAQHSNTALGAIVQQALVGTAVPPAAIVGFFSADHESMRTMLQWEDLIDLVIPRGGEGLIRFVVEHSKIPVLKHYKGVCHTLVDAGANLDQAEEIVVNAKVSRPSACNALETLLVHADIAEAALPRLARALTQQGVVLHICPQTREILVQQSPDVAAGAIDATDEDWAAEYLGPELAIRVVDSVAAGIAHIARWGTDHTEAILTRSSESAAQFVRDVRSGTVIVNASTRFADGGELGLGAEIGISTSRMHAYGPMGAEGLTTTRFVVLGTGQIR